MSNPISTYNLFYKSMTEESRDALSAEIDRILTESVRHAQDQLIASVQKAATELYSNLYTNPWPQLIKEDGGSYALLRSLSDFIWEEMLKSDPTDFAKKRYEFIALIDAWRVKYPDDFASVVNNIILQENIELKARLARLHC